MISMTFKFAPALLLILSLSVSSSAFAGDSTVGDASGQAASIQVTELRYMEREPGVDDYEVIVQVSDRYIRIDDLTDDSGYIIFDDVDDRIYSVSHFDKSVLVIDKFRFSESATPATGKVEYLELADAPSVAGKKVFNYRIYTGEAGEEETCTDIQLVEDLLPDVRQKLKSYRNVVSGQQVKMTDNRITEVQTACYYIDQIYNTGSYYDKGLPIQEWHSNGRYKALTSFDKISVTKGRFQVPDEYRRFSIDKDSARIMSAN